MASGPNAVGANMLVFMQANRSFPTEVPIYMHGEDGEETEDMVKLTYLKPPPICGNCESFDHTTTNCKVMARENAIKTPKEKETENSIEEEVATIDGQTAGKIQWKTKKK